MRVRLIAPALALCGVLASCLPAAAADQTPESIFERSRPATLMIVAHFQAKASVPEATFPQEKAALLHERLDGALSLNRERAGRFAS